MAPGSVPVRSLLCVSFALACPTRDRRARVCFEVIFYELKELPAGQGRDHGAPHGFEPASANVWIDLEALLAESQVTEGIVVRSPQMKQILATAAQLSNYNAAVLIQGESGTGKELVARAIHNLGTRASQPFVTFNCSNLVESLAESQLFGHVRGAFTDAREDSLGYFRSANGGTLFLDEIGELPLRLQPKLLRAVETLEIQPVGSSRSYQVDVRLVAATNHDLLSMVRAGQFRDDLYYRLNTISLTIAPLRDRREVIAPLVAYFVARYNRVFLKNVRYLSRRALGALHCHDWPGNVRELCHVVESAVILTDDDRLDIETLPKYIFEPSASPLTIAVTGSAESQPSPNWAGGGAGALADDPGGVVSLDEVIKRALVRSLQESEGNRRRAASLLGISRSTLYRMLSRYGLDSPGRRASRTEST